MDAMISLLVAVLAFSILAYVAFWICDKAGWPPPARWIVGAILFLILLYVIGGFIHPVAWSTFGHR